MKYRIGFKTTQNYLEKLIQYVAPMNTESILKNTFEYSHK